GGGSLAGTVDQEVEYLAPATPGLARLMVSVRQRDVTCTAEALITVTASLEATMSTAIVNARGLPGYTFERAAGELWRSRYDAERNLIIVNNGHRDFVFATKNRALQLRYLVRLYEGAGAEKLHRRSPGAAARAHDRAVALCGGEAENGRILSPELNDSKHSERGQFRIACSSTSAINDHPRPAPGVAFAIKAEVVSTAATKREQRTVRRVTVETGL